MTGHSGVGNPVPARFAEVVRRLDAGQGIWIDNTGHPGDGGRTLPVTDPATGEVITHLADASPEQARAAVDAAADALPGWAARPQRERAELLRASFELMSAQAEDLAGLMAWENGKALPDARGEAGYAAEFFRWFAEEAARSEGGYGPAPAGGTRTIVSHQPIGVSALVTPWNFPAAMATRKIAPALAAGCTVVLKPAKETPLTALAIVRMLARAGVPDGVVNLVPTSSSSSVVTPWLEDPRVRKLSFTGSTEVGRLLLHQAADRIVNCSMELGGNAPFVVAADADLDAAVDGAMVAKLRNGGQACTAANRFYVHADIADAFVEAFGARVAALRVGPAFADGVNVGPMVNRAAAADVARLVDAALADGARVSHVAALPPGLDGTAGDGAHAYYPPTVLVDVAPDADIVATEIFGPVAPIVTWRDEVELISWVNATELGLSAYVYAGDLRWALRFAESVEAGMVGVNRGIVSDPAAPFGGMKQSGLGREGAREGIREFQETQYFSVDWP
ncbi:MAG TPA: NAD-dependent succinate-semialdehyde dehydrogenase [Dermatophilaceae bacterium]|nr:NAD-dependent succinate-semialdehyde dehydrogenase [Dermatophilaceae bacterium]